jgi:hypothetical protein
MSLKEKFENFVFDILDNYVDNCDANAIKLNLWEGNVKLTDLILKEQYFPVDNHSSVTLESGSIGLLELAIPWTSLSTGNVAVELRDVELTLSLNNLTYLRTSDGSYHHQSPIDKLNYLIEEELLLLCRDKTMLPNESSTWFGNMLTNISESIISRITNGFSFSCHNITVHFIVPYSNHHYLKYCIHFNSMNVEKSVSKGKVVFTKNIQIRGFTLSLSTAFYTAETMIEQTKYTNNDVIINSCNALVEITCSKSDDKANIPAISLSLVLSNFEVTISTLQLTLIADCIDHNRRMILAAKLFMIHQIISNKIDFEDAKKRGIPFNVYAAHRKLETKKDYRRLWRVAIESILLLNRGTLHVKTRYNIGYLYSMKYVEYIKHMNKSYNSKRNIEDEGNAYTESDTRLLAYVLHSKPTNNLSESREARESTEDIDTSLMEYYHGVLSDVDVLFYRYLSIQAMRTEVESGALDLSNYVKYLRSKLKRGSDASEPSVEHKAGWFNRASSHEDAPSIEEMYQLYMANYTKRKNMTLEKEIMRFFRLSPNDAVVGSSLIWKSEVNVTRFSCIIRDSPLRVGGKTSFTGKPLVGTTSSRILQFTCYGIVASSRYRDEHDCSLALEVAGLKAYSIEGVELLAIGQEQEEAESQAAITLKVLITPIQRTSNPFYAIGLLFGSASGNNRGGNHCRHVDVKLMCDCIHVHYEKNTIFVINRLLQRTQKMLNKDEITVKETAGAVIATDNTYSFDLNIDGFNFVSPGRGITEGVDSYAFFQVTHFYIKGGRYLQETINMLENQNQVYDPCSNMYSTGSDGYPYRRVDDIVHEDVSNNAEVIREVMENQSPVCYPFIFCVSNVVLSTVRKDVAQFMGHDINVTPVTFRGIIFQLDVMKPAADKAKGIGYYTSIRINVFSSPIDLCTTQSDLILLTDVMNSCYDPVTRASQPVANSVFRLEKYSSCLNFTLNFVCKIFKLTLLKHRLNDADPVQGADRDYVHYLITKMLHAFASNIQIRGANSYYVETAKTLVTERLLYLLQDDFASDSNLGAMVETYLSNLIQEIEPPSSYKDGDVDQSLVDAVVAECVTTLMNYYSSDNRINESIMVQLVFRDIGLSSYQYMYDSLSLVTVGELLLVDEYSYPILALINEKARSKDKQRKVRAHMGKKLSGKYADPLGKGSKGKAEIVSKIANMTTEEIHEMVVQGVSAGGFKFIDHENYAISISFIDQDRNPLFGLGMGGYDEMNVYKNMRRIETSQALHNNRDLKFMIMLNSLNVHLSATLIPNLLESVLPVINSMQPSPASNAAGNVAESPVIYANKNVSMNLTVSTINAIMGVDDVMLFRFISKSNDFQYSQYMVVAGHHKVVTTTVSYKSSNMKLFDLTEAGSRYWQILYSDAAGDRSMGLNDFNIFVERKQQLDARNQVDLSKKQALHVKADLAKFHICYLQRSVVCLNDFISIQLLERINHVMKKSEEKKEVLEDEGNVASTAFLSSNKAAIWSYESDDNSDDSMDSDDYDNVPVTIKKDRLASRMIDKTPARGNDSISIQHQRKLVFSNPVRRHGKTADQAADAKAVSPVTEFDVTVEIVLSNLVLLLPRNSISSEIVAIKVLRSHIKISDVQETWRPPASTIVSTDGKYLTFNPVSNEWENVGVYVLQKQNVASLQKIVVDIGDEDEDDEFYDSISDTPVNYAKGGDLPRDKQRCVRTTIDLESVQVYTSLDKKLRNDHARDIYKHMEHTFNSVDKDGSVYMELDSDMDDAKKWHLVSEPPFSLRIISDSLPGMLRNIITNHKNDDIKLALSMAEYYLILSVIFDNFEEKHFREFSYVSDETEALPGAEGGAATPPLYGTKHYIEYLLRCVSSSSMESLVVLADVKLEMAMDLDYFCKDPSPLIAELRNQVKATVTDVADIAALHIGGFCVHSKSSNAAIHTAVAASHVEVFDRRPISNRFSERAIISARLTDVGSKIYYFKPNFQFGLDPSSTFYDITDNVLKNPFVMLGLSDSYMLSNRVSHNDGDWVGLTDSVINNAYKYIVDSYSSKEDDNEEFRSRAATLLTAVNRCKKALEAAIQKSNLALINSWYEESHRVRSIPLQCSFHASSESNWGTIAVGIDEVEVAVHCIDILMLIGDYFSAYDIEPVCGNPKTQIFHKIPLEDRPCTGNDLRLFIRRPHLKVLRTLTSSTSGALILEATEDGMSYMPGSIHNGGVYYRQLLDSSNSKNIEFKASNLAVIYLANNSDAMPGIRGSAGSGRGVRTLLENFYISVFSQFVDAKHYFKVDTQHCADNRSGSSLFEFVNNDNTENTLFNPKENEYNSDSIGLPFIVEPSVLFQTDNTKPAVNALSSNIVISYDDLYFLSNIVSSLLGIKASAETGGAASPVQSPSKAESDSSNKFNELQDPSDTPAVFGVVSLASIRVVIVDSVLGLHLPLFQSFIQKLDLVIDNEFSNSHKIFAEISLWFDYFNNMKKCWEPFIEKLKVVTLFQQNQLVPISETRTESIGWGLTLRVLSDIHVNLSGSLIRTIDDTVHMLNTSGNNKYVRNSDAQVEASSEVLPSKKRSESLTSKKRTSSVEMHREHVPLSDSDRVGFSILNLTGQPIRYIQRLESAYSIEYLQDRGRGNLNFTACATKINNMKIVEDAFNVQVVNNVRAGSSNDRVSHQVAIQIIGYEWFPSVQVDEIGTKNLCLVPLQPVPTEDELARTALNIVSTVSPKHGGRMLTLRSIFTIRNNCSHTIDLYTIAEHIIDKARIHEYLDEATVPFPIATGDEFQIPLGLMSCSIQKSHGFFFGEIFLKPHDEVTELKKHFPELVKYNPDKVEPSNDSIDIKDIVETRGNHDFQVSCDIISKSRNKTRRESDLESTRDVSAAKKQWFSYSIEIIRNDFSTLHASHEGIKSSNKHMIQKVMAMAKPLFGSHSHAVDSALTTNNVDYTIVINPPIILENLLPCGGIFQIIHTTQKNTLWSGEIMPGHVKSIHTVILNDPLTLLITLPHCKSLQGVEFHRPIQGKRHHRTMKDKITDKLNAIGLGDNDEDVDPGMTYMILADREGQRLRINIENILGSSGHRHVTIYCPYWIVNTSQYSFRIRQDGHKILTAGSSTPLLDGAKSDSEEDILKIKNRSIYPGNKGPLHHEKPENSKGFSTINHSNCELLSEQLALDKIIDLAYMFNFEDDINVLGNRRVLLQLDDSEWSSPFSIDSVGVKQSIKIEDDKHGVLEVGFNIFAAPSSRLSKYTKVIRFMPRFLIVNNTDDVIEITQPAMFNDSGSYTQTKTISPKSILPYHLPNIVDERLLSCRIHTGEKKSKETWLRSVAFPIDSLESYNLLLKRKYDLNAIPHVQTRSSAEYTVEFPRLITDKSGHIPAEDKFVTEIGVWFETDWQETNIVVKGLKPGSWAANESGIQVGDVLLQLNKDSYTGKEFEKCMKSLKEQLRVGKCTVVFRTVEEKIRLIRASAAGNTDSSLTNLSKPKASTGNNVDFNVITVALKAYDACTKITLTPVDLTKKSEYRIRNGTASHIIYFKQTVRFTALGRFSDIWSTIYPGEEVNYFFENPVIDSRIEKKQISVKLGPNILCPEHITHHDFTKVYYLEDMIAEPVDFIRSLTNYKQKRHNKIDINFDIIGAEARIETNSYSEEKVGIKVSVTSQNNIKLVQIVPDSTKYVNESKYCKQFAVKQVEILKELDEKLNHLVGDFQSAVDQELLEATERLNAFQATLDPFKLTAFSEFKQLLDTDTNKSNQLVVEVLECKELRPFVTGQKENIYCRIELKKTIDSLISRRKCLAFKSTYVCNQTLDPTWINQKFVIETPEDAVNLSSSYTMKVSVFCKGLIQKAKLIGAMELPLSCLNEDSLKRSRGDALKRLRDDALDENPSVGENVLYILCEKAVAEGTNDKDVFTLTEDIIKSLSKSAEKATRDSDPTKRLSKDAYHRIMQALEPKLDLSGWFPLSSKRAVLRQTSEDSTYANAGSVGSIRLRLHWIHSNQGLKNSFRLSIKRRISELDNLLSSIGKSVSKSIADEASKVSKTRNSRSSRNSFLETARARANTLKLLTGGSESPESIHRRSIRLTPSPINIETRASPSPRKSYLMQWNHDDAIHKWISCSSNIPKTAAKDLLYQRKRWFKLYQERLFHDGIQREYQRSIVYVGSRRGSIEIYPVTVENVGHLSRGSYVFCRATFGNQVCASQSIRCESISTESSFVQKDSSGNIICPFKFDIDLTDIKKKYIGSIFIGVMNETYSALKEVKNVELPIFRLLESICAETSNNGWFTRYFPLYNPNFTNHYGDHIRLNEYSESKEEKGTLIEHHPRIQLTMRWVPESSAPASAGNNDDISAQRRHSITSDNILNTSKNYMRLQVPSLSIAVIDSRNSRELMQVSANGIDVRYSENLEYADTIVNIDWCQLDNQLPDAAAPVLLAPLVTKKPQPTLRLHLIKNTNPLISGYDKIAVVVQELDLNLEQDTVIGMWDTIQSWYDEHESALKDHAIDINEMKHARLFGYQTKDLDVVESKTPLFAIFSPAKASATSVVDVNGMFMSNTDEDTAEYVYVRDFYISPISIKVSFLITAESHALTSVRHRYNQPHQSTLDADIGLTTAISAFLWQVGEVVLDLTSTISDAPIYVEEIDRSHLFYVHSEFSKMLQSHYFQQLLACLYKIIGSLDLVGNPVGLLSNIKEGVKDLFIVPLNVLIESPQEFVDALRKGTASLVYNATDGFIGTGSSITRSVGRTAAKLTMDSDFIKSREKLQRPIKKYQEALTLARKDVLNAVYYAIIGVLSVPMSSFKWQKPFSSLSVGLVNGLLGLGLKPLVGALDAATHTAEAIRIVVKYTTREYYEPLRRRRYSNSFGPDGRILSYNFECALGNDLLNTIEQLKRVQRIGNAFHEGGRIMSGVGVFLTNNRLFGRHKLDRTQSQRSMTKQQSLHIANSIASKSLHSTDRTENVVFCTVLFYPYDEEGYQVAVLTNSRLLVCDCRFRRQEAPLTQFECDLDTIKEAGFLEKSSFDRFGTLTITLKDSKDMDTPTAAPVASNHSRISRLGNRIGNRIGNAVGNIADSIAHNFSSSTNQFSITCASRDQGKLSALRNCIYIVKQEFDKVSYTPESNQYYQSSNNHYSLDEEVGIASVGPWEFSKNDEKSNNTAAKLCDNGIKWHCVQTQDFLARNTTPKWLADERVKLVTYHQAVKTHALEEGTVDAVDSSKISKKVAETYVTGSSRSNDLLNLSIGAFKGVKGVFNSATSALVGGLSPNTSSNVQSVSSNNESNEDIASINETSSGRLASNKAKAAPVTGGSTLRNIIARKRSSTETFQSDDSKRSITPTPVLDGEKEFRAISSMVHSSVSEDLEDYSFLSDSTVDSAQLQTLLDRIARLERALLKEK